MAKFLRYLDSDWTLSQRLWSTARDLGVTNDQIEDVMAFLRPISVKDRATFDHSYRVSLLGTQIARLIYLDPKAMFYAGLLHDVGKAQTRLAVLQKTEGWTEDDTQEMMSHVMDGYRLIRDKFDFSAEIILWHHRFQPRGYPKEYPEPLHEYSEATKVMIPWYGKILSMADTFDALHRVNDKHGENTLTGDQIKEKMFVFHKEHRPLVEGIYQAGIFTTQIFEEEKS